MYKARFLLMVMVALPSALFSQDFDLELGDFDPCSQTLDLSWEAFPDWPGGVDHYEVWASVKSPASDFPGPAALVDSVGGNTTTFSFFAEDGRQHCLQILAISSEKNDTVRSNQECLEVPIIGFPESIIINTASLIPENGAFSGMVELIWETQPLLPLGSATLLRSRNGGDFEPIAQLDPTFPFYFDSLANAHLYPVSYRIEGIDECGNVLTSNRVTTIFLQGEVNDAGVAVLEWTPYENEYYFDGLEYHVLTDVFPGSIDFQSPQAVYPSDVLMHTEQPDPGGPDDGTNCYTIISEPRLERNGFFFFNTTTFSNQVCPVADLAVFVPNAFAPDGANPEFRVYSPGGSAINFSMRIFNRNGSMLFESQDIDRGWDGTFNGKPLPSGVYVYFIEIEQGDKPVLTKKGSIVLVR
ncbi:gliding motility-associated C-terminal domain-containing protein [Flavilitoribacter nigricans]|uniref:Gliding motility-associated C-terminal domain-containing protein n=1 Tax=Flavilitoribacter nigricans (strain ATCC 23147 / DSM 23189 / NBRC 102662 / NCIMB 1420 / SS-2) TaxID=1122177 RepID=A0A2D0NGE8_FLAN2|nr:gliding motility-associated C-terminal domain-containing protein [Flavilitoribacter nigricans]PHN07488.1 hypothetical protein CRP01_05140 [Flavilitoribacter nigricans DSM 23189 = NBRC 102662]